MLSAAIFDVDGVLLASPHERAWREALRGFAEPDRFTTSMYQAHVAESRVSAVRAPLWNNWACWMPSSRPSSMPSANRSDLRN